MKNENFVWEQLASELYEASADKYCEDLNEIKLLCAIICRMGQDGNKEYFDSLAFKEICWLLKLDSTIVKSTINTIWSAK